MLENITVVMDTYKSRIVQMQKQKEFFININTGTDIPDAFFFSHCNAWMAFNHKQHFGNIILVIHMLEKFDELTVE